MIFYTLIGLVPLVLFWTLTPTSGEMETVYSTLPNNTSTPMLPPSAEKLTRPRSYHPITIIKHYIQSPKRTKQRERLRTHRIKNESPSQRYEEPFTNYKQPPRLGPSEHSSFTSNDLKKINFDTFDTDILPSSYEAQVMDLDFYSHSSFPYRLPKVPSGAYSSDLVPRTPAPFRKPVKPITMVNPKREPHRTYGVPYENTHSYFGKIPSFGHGYKEEHLPVGSHVDGDEKIISGGCSNFHRSPQLHTYASTDSIHYNNNGIRHPYQAEHPSSSEDVALEWQKHSKRFPSLNDDSSSQSQENKYKVHKQILSSDFQSERYHFAEPPLPRSHVQVTYSPFYEISIPPKSEQSYEVFTEQSENFAKPTEYLPEHSTVISPKNLSTEPGDVQPLNATANQAPRVPEIPQESYTPDSVNLPLIPDHRQPAYSYTKTSYEVPLYDPVSYGSLNKEYQERYPPKASDSSLKTTREFQGCVGENNTQDSHSNRTPKADLPSNKPELDTYALSTSITTKKESKPWQKVKRKRKPTDLYDQLKNLPMKHILDAPELLEAFETDVRKKVVPYPADDEANESSKIKKTSYQVLNTLAPSVENEGYLSQAWDPMRIQTSPTTQSLFTKAAFGRLHNKENAPGYISYPTRTGNFTKFPGHLEVLSIQKSRSHSYYDGTVPTPMSHSVPKGFKSTTRTSSGNQSAFPSKQTFGNIHESTLSESSHNEKQILPKNHKLY